MRSPTTFCRPERHREPGMILLRLPFTPLVSPRGRKDEPRLRGQASSVVAGRARRSITLLRADRGPAPLFAGSSLGAPFVFERASCEHEIAIDRETIRDAFRLTEPDFNSVGTVNAVLDQRGWTRTDRLMFCLDCVEDRD